MRAVASALVLLAAVPAVPAAAVPAEDGALLYAALRDAVPEPETAFAVTGVALVRGDAQVLLDGGIVYPLTAAGRVFGAVFDGRGRFLFTPPAGVERDQLERFSGERAVSTEFELAVLFFSDDSAAELARSGRRPRTPPDPRDARRYLEKRRREHREKWGLNVAARLLYGYLGEPTGLFVAQPKTDEHGVLTLWLDPSEEEPTKLYQYTKRWGGMMDTWCSYRGRAPPAPPDAVVSSYEIDVRLDDDTLSSEVVAAVVEPRGGTPRVLFFKLHPLMEVVAVETPAGEPLYWVREEMNDGASPILALVLPEALCAPRTIVFALGGDIIEDFHRGEYGIKVTEAWYPRLGYYRRATYGLRFDVSDRHELFASGRLIAEREVGGRRLSRWLQTFPVAAVAFNYGDMKTHEVELAGGPRVTVFGREKGFAVGDLMREVGEDVAMSLAYFIDIFGPYPFTEMYATRIPYGHGQGFPGLLHLSKGTFGGGFRGVDEAFRGHEVAHQWWGHVVGWRTYRDQWLSEGFALYSGALYAARSLDDRKVLARMLRSWRHDILGVGNLDKSLGLSQFGYSREMMKYSDGSEAGPIALGRRLASSKSPIDYRLLVYEKGAWVLHMLRMLFYDFERDNDTAFTDLMRDFVAEHYGGDATTADFRAVVERHRGADMGWFFDQWIFGTWIPRYKFAWRAQRDAGGQFVKLRLRQELPPGAAEFRMEVPFTIELADGTRRVERVTIEGAEATRDVRVGAAVRKVEINTLSAVLCESDDERF